jgi:hypothetical protein
MIPHVNKDEAPVMPKHSRYNSLCPLRVAALTHFFQFV